MPIALVTVIVAGRDIATLAPAALQSLQQQTEPRWRAILVDDGSVDDTGTIFARFAEQDSRFEVVSYPQSRGLGAARNMALAMVETEYIAFLDADDVMRPGMLELALESLQASGSDIAVGGYVRLRFTEGAWVTGPVQPWVLASISPAQIGASVDSHPDVVGNIVAWSKVSRRSLWQRTQTVFPEGVMYEDQAVAQRLYTQAAGIDLIDEVFVEWRIRHDGSSITQREADPRVLQDCVTQMAAGLSILREHSPTALARRTTQILRMDLPRLVTEAGENPVSRATLESFARGLEPTAGDLTLRTQSPAYPNDPLAPTIGEVLERVLG